MRIIEDIKLDFSDVLILPKTSTLTSRSDVSLTRSFKLKHAGWDWVGIPIVAANMNTTGTVGMANVFSEYEMAVALHKHYHIEEVVDHLIANEFYSFYSMGISEGDFDKLQIFKSIALRWPRMVCVDVANGYTEKFLDSVKRLRDLMPDTFIMAGNVVTPEKTEEVLKGGADCVKIGIGPGSVCTTRMKTGVGYPQLSAIIECADAAHGLRGLICADGGCTVPGDIAKAFGGGADFVMIGGMLAGTDESGGTRVHVDNNGIVCDAAGCNLPVTHLEFYGMSSRKANDAFAGGLNDYRAAEGKEVLVPYKGRVAHVVDDILGGIRSTLTYVGARELKELTKRTTFVRVSNQLNGIFD
jgi:GMP reductase